MKTFKKAVAVTIAVTGLAIMPVAASAVPVAPAPTHSAKSCKVDLGRVILVYKDGESFTKGNHTYTCENGIWRMKRTPAPTQETTHAR